MAALVPQSEFDKNLSKNLWAKLAWKQRRKEGVFFVVAFTTTKEPETYNVMYPAFVDFRKTSNKGYSKMEENPFCHWDK